MSLLLGGSDENGKVYDETYWISTHFKNSWDQFPFSCDQNSGLFQDYTHIGALTVGGSWTEWYWVETGEKLNFALKFGPGEPDNDGEELCLSIGEKRELFFNDIKCNGNSKRFMCQTQTFVAE